MSLAEVLAINWHCHFKFSSLCEPRHEEIAAANRGLNSGVLSAFIGAPGPGFMVDQKFRRLNEKLRNCLV